MTKYIYEFGPTKTEGDLSQKSLLGGKGANLAEMAKLGLPVPPGFTISTECCNHYFDLNERFPDSLESETMAAMANVEAQVGLRFGDPDNPLLVSCRSGSRSAMPGMMETILNVGLCSATISGLTQKTGNEWFVYDAYRRLIMMYSDVVMEKAEQVVPRGRIGVRLKFEMMMNRLKKDKGYNNDIDLSINDLKALCDKFKKRIRDDLGADFPDDPRKQLLGAIGAAFKSWKGKWVASYRRDKGIPDNWGTAVIIQAMVGEMSEMPGTDVAFYRNSVIGANKFYGECTLNAQGEDVVAAPPNPLDKCRDNKHMQETDKVCRHIAFLMEPNPMIVHSGVRFEGRRLERDSCCEPEKRIGSKKKAQHRLQKTDLLETELRHPESRTGDSLNETHSKDSVLAGDELIVVNLATLKEMKKGNVLEYNGMVHDVRSKLSAVILYAQLLEKKENNPKRKGYIEKILKVANSIKAFTFIDEPRSINIKDFLDEFIMSHLPEKPESVDVVFRNTDYHVMVYAEPSRLQRILVNFCENSYRAIAAKTNGRLEIFSEIISHSNGGKNVAIAVSDNGVGIPKDMQDSIFEAGMSSKPDSKNHGMGLCNCRRFAKEHGGDIDVQSGVRTVDSGGLMTTMRLILPVILLN